MISAMSGIVDLSELVSDGHLRISELRGCRLVEHQVVYR